MGAINIGARNGGKVKVVAPDNPAVDTEAILPKKSGTLATLEDISNITDLDAEGLSNLAEQVEQNKQDIVELEEEIEALAPSFDRGEWDFHEPETLPTIPNAKTFYIVNEAGGIALDYADTHKVVFNNTDAKDDVHTWANIEVGQYLEMFDERDGEFLLATVDAIILDENFATFEVTVQKSDGGPRGISGDDDYKHRVRVKFFEIEGGVDIDSLMPKSGGTFTGNVTYNGEITNDKHITTKEYVVSAVSGANVSAGRSWEGVNRRPSSSTKFCTDATQPKDINKIWMHRDFIEQYIQGPTRKFRAGGMITLDKGGEVYGMYVVYQLIDQGGQDIYFSVKGISTVNYNLISNQNYGVTFYCAFST